jgi:starch phosphorylase
MKVVLNGGLNLSVLDGWWEEAYDGETGWAIHSSPEGGDGAQDDRDGIALFNLLEHEIIPLFYERDEAGVPRRWLARVKASMRRLIPRFSAERMLNDYLERYYTAPGEGASGAGRRRGRGSTKHGEG